MLKVRQELLNFKLLEIFKLETHERIHLGDIPFKCTKCDKTTWWDMRPHRREGIQVHKVLQELLYIKLLENPWEDPLRKNPIQKCTKCDKCFQHQVPWRIMRGPTQGRSLSNAQNVTRASQNPSRISVKKTKNRDDAQLVLIWGREIRKNQPTCTVRLRVRLAERRHFNESNSCRHWNTAGKKQPKTISSKV